MLGSLEYFNEFYADYQKTIKNWNYAEDGVAFYLCANYYICNDKLSQSSWQVFKMLFINTRAEKKYFFHYLGVIYGSIQENLCHIVFSITFTNHAV